MTALPLRHWFLLHLIIVGPRMFSSRRNLCWIRPSGSGLMFSSTQRDPVSFANTFYRLNFGNFVCSQWLRNFAQSWLLYLVGLLHWRSSALARSTLSRQRCRGNLRGNVRDTIARKILWALSCTWRRFVAQSNPIANSCLRIWIHILIRMHAYSVVGARIFDRHTAGHLWLDFNVIIKVCDTTL